MIRPARPRGSLVYDKQPLSLEELVDRLMARGLHVPEPDRAARYLRHIGYYRLSPTRSPSDRPELTTPSGQGRGSTICLTSMYSTGLCACW